jgi:hypothetical protein
MYLEGLKRVLNDNNPNQLDTLPLQITNGKQSTD